MNEPRYILHDSPEYDHVTVLMNDLKFKRRIPAGVVVGWLVDPYVEGARTLVPWHDPHPLTGPEPISDHVAESYFHLGLQNRAPILATICVIIEKMFNHGL